MILFGVEEQNGQTDNQWFPILFFSYVRPSWGCMCLVRKTNGRFTVNEPTDG